MNQLKFINNLIDELNKSKISNINYTSKIDEIIDVFSHLNNSLKNNVNNEEVNLEHYENDIINLNKKYDALTNSLDEKLLILKKSHEADIDNSIVIINTILKNNIDKHNHKVSALITNILKQEQKTEHDITDIKSFFNRREKDIFDRMSKYKKSINTGIIEVENRKNENSLRINTDFKSRTEKTKELFKKSDNHFAEQLEFLNEEIIKIEQERNDILTFTRQNYFQSSTFYNSRINSLKKNYITKNKELDDEFDDETTSLKSALDSYKNLEVKDNKMILFKFKKLLDDSNDIFDEQKEYYHNRLKRLSRVTSENEQIVQYFSYTDHHLKEINQWRIEKNSIDLTNKYEIKKNELIYSEKTASLQLDLSKYKLKKECQKNYFSNAYSHKLNYTETMISLSSLIYDREVGLINNDYDKLITLKSLEKNTINFEINNLKIKERYSMNNLEDIYMSSIKENSIYYQLEFEKEYLKIKNNLKKFDIEKVILELEYKKKQLEENYRLSYYKIQKDFERIILESHDNFLKNHVKYSSYKEILKKRYDFNVEKGSLLTTILTHQIEKSIALGKLVLDLNQKNIDILFSQIIEIEKTFTSVIKILREIQSPHILILVKNYLYETLEYSYNNIDSFIKKEQQSNFEKIKNLSTYRYQILENRLNSIHNLEIEMLNYEIADIRVEINTLNDEISYIDKSCQKYNSSIENMKNTNTSTNRQLLSHRKRIKELEITRKNISGDLEQEENKLIPVLAKIKENENIWNTKIQELKATKSINLNSNIEKTTKMKSKYLHLLSMTKQLKDNFSNDFDSVILDEQKHINPKLTKNLEMRVINFHLKTLKTLNDFYNKELHFYALETTKLIQSGNTIKNSVKISFMKNKESIQSKISQNKNRRLMTKNSEMLEFNNNIKKTKLLFSKRINILDKQISINTVNLNAPIKIDDVLKAINENQVVYVNTELTERKRLLKTNQSDLNQRLIEAQKNRNDYESTLLSRIDQYKIKVENIFEKYDVAKKNLELTYKSSKRAFFQNDTTSFNNYEQKIKNVDKEIKLIPITYKRKNVILVNSIKSSSRKTILFLEKEYKNDIFNLRKMSKKVK